MDRRMAEADRLSSEGKDEEALELLRAALSEAPRNTRANLACARVLDGLGREREAIPRYELAMEAGLSGDDLEEATINLGSSYRVVGEPEKAAGLLRASVERFPENRALGVFLSMALHDLGEHAEATGLLLRALAETSSDPWVGRYARAITFYSERLDGTPTG